MNMRREKMLMPEYTPIPNSSSSFSVERALADRLDQVRRALISEAEGRDWDTDAVDRILESGGLPPMTREYVVQYVESVDREVRVRAKDSEHASQIASLDGPGVRLVGVKEIVE